MLAASLLLLALIVATATLYKSSSEDRAGSVEASVQADPEYSFVPVEPPEVPPYVPGPAEELPNGKSFAAEVAQAALTYPRGSSAKQLANSLRRFGAKIPPKVLRPAFDPAARAWARVVYPQLSGYTGTTMGAMVVAEQVVEGEDRTRRSDTRVVDVRLRLDGDDWVLDQLASVGGGPPARRASLGEAARQVLANPRVGLPDSSRWDIERGKVDEGLLEALLAAAKRYELQVAVLITGHPPNVWATDRPSAHSAGLAADIFAVDGRDVIRQRHTGSSAFELTESFLAGGAAQVGSPWSFDPSGVRSFTDDVHQDHLHLQQSG